MYSTLLSQIETVLTGIARIKELNMYPRTDLGMFPAVSVNPGGIENSFNSSADNMKVYRFDIHVMVGLSDAMTAQQAYTTTLPNVVDDIIAAFDAQWDAGTNSGGHRIWQKIDVAQPWQVIDDKDGLTAYAPLSLVIKVVTDV